MMQDRQLLTVVMMVSICSALLSGCTGCAGKCCPDSKAEETQMQSVQPPELQNLDYDWDHDGVVGLNDVSLALEAHEHCRKP